jgi:pimeloyl-ACP methyl ester carboxylesterase
MASHRTPTLLLLPGLDGTGMLLRRLREALGTDIPTVLVAYPADRALGYAALEEIARARLPGQRSFVLLAESFSGPIALSIAATRPAGLRGLILACSFARNPLPALAPLRRLAWLLPVHRVPGAVLAWPTLGRFANAELRSELVSALRQVSASAIAERLRAVAEVDVSPLLAHVDVPALYLRASADRLVPQSAVDNLAAIPGIRLVEVEGPHFLLQANPSAAASYVRSFLREIQAAE